MPCIKNDTDNKLFGFVVSTVVSTIVCLTACLLVPVVIAGSISVWRKGLVENQNGGSRSS